MTISGGEPLFQPEFTAEILRRCKEKGIHTAIETSGFASPAVWKDVVTYCDLVLFDIKATDEEKHLEYTGVPLNIILRNLKTVNEMQIPFVVRLPIIPGLNDRKAHFSAVKALVKTLTCCRGAEIMPYHKLGEYKYQQLGREYRCQHVAEPTKEQVKEWNAFLKTDGS